jgi:ABC-type transport system involved in multi-copper enzyme maturation permease subunit
MSAGGSKLLAIGRVLTIARFTLLEARRTRLPWLIAAVLTGLLLLSVFVQQVAITETHRLQLGFLAAGARLAMVFVLTLYIAGSMAREFSDKGVDLLLSLDLPRAGWYLGKLAGCLGIALAMALAATATLALPSLGVSALAALGLALAPVGVPPDLVLWGLSLAFELTLIATLTLFCVITFAQPMPAVSFVAAFYLLARSVAAMRLLAGSQLLDPHSWSARLSTWVVDGLALVLPDLSRFTATAWLVNGAGDAQALAFVAAQSALYATLLALAGLFDLYRKNL